MVEETTLQAAVSDVVEPGDTIHFRRGYEFPFAAAFELTRQFWNADPAFTFVCTGVSEWAIPALLNGQVERLVASFAGYSYPTPGRSDVITDRSSSDVRLENWSLYTLIQRLRAGALGFPFVPTNSLEGSSMGEDAEMATVESPFADDDSLVLSPLAPDVSILNGVVADRAGNVVCSPVQVEGNWGVYGSDRVIATVERVVDEEELREHNDATTIPGHLVDRVVEVPFGSHPRPLFNPSGVGGVQGYHFDREFYETFRQATRDRAALEDWIQEWILGADHESYLEQLGTDRLYRLSGRHGLEYSQLDAVTRTEPRPAVGDEPPGDRERMIVRAADLLGERVDEASHEVVFAGLGTSHLAVWLYQSLAEDPAPLLVEAGMYGFTAEFGDTYVFSTPAMPTASVLSDTTFALGQVMSSSSTLAVLTGAQVDRRGNVNSSRIGDRHFVGSGGANDALSTADEVVLVLQASPKRLVDEVEFVTGPGRNVSRVVTQHGVLRRQDGDLVVDTVFLEPDETIDDRVEAFDASVGWALGTADSVTEQTWSADLDDRVTVLRAHDPPGDYRA